MDGSENGAIRATDARREPAPAGAGRVAALVPFHRTLPDAGLLSDVRSHVDELLLVDDGTPPESAGDVAALADDLDAPVLRLPTNSGKGHAVAAGLRYLRAADPAPKAVVIVDADGQHPPTAIPALMEAAVGAELVVADRFGDLGAMPWQRRVPNRIASLILELTTGREVRDSQCGMRLLRGRALHEIRFPGGGFEAETRHLKACLRAGVRVAWVPIPALYPGGKSAFRPVRDSLRVAAALLG